MTPDKSASRRRIAITFDTGHIDTEQLERLTRLAVRLDAELEGVFVEDSDLFRLAELSFLQEFRLTSRRIDRVQSTRLQHELRVVARQAERALAMHARNRGVPWSFRVWRGSIERELLEGLEADVLALTRLGAIFSGPSRRKAPKVVTACLDGSEGDASVLGTATDIIADSDRLSLQVLLAPGPNVLAKDIQRRAGETLAASPMPVEFLSLEERKLSELVRVLRDSGSCALVIHRDNPLLRSRPLKESLAQLNCPLFLVR